jgi:hypothetical protein
MPIKPLNAAGGFSTGLTATQVIDQFGNVSANGLSLSSSISFSDGTTQSTKAYDSNHCGFVRLTDPPVKILHGPDGAAVQTLSNVASFGLTGSYILLLHAFSFTSGCTLNTLMTVGGGSSSGHTGSLLFAVYDVDPSSGLPLNKLYESSELNIGNTNFIRYTASPNTRLDPGTYWIGFLLNNPAGKAAATWSWAVVTTHSNTWEVEGITGVSRFFNTGQMDHLRYRFAGMTLPDVLTHGFTAAITLNTDPAIGWGTSESVAGSRSPWVGIGVVQ